MRTQTQFADTVIRGSCSLYACRCCRTKYGWPHQGWCDLFEFTEPGCGDCRYYSRHFNECIHPAQKREGRELPHEKTERPL